MTDAKYQSPYYGKLKHRQIMACLKWTNYHANIWRLYNDDKMSAPEIAQFINENTPNWFMGISARSIQRALNTYAKSLGIHKGTRSVGDSFRLAVQRGRVKWAYKEYKIKRPNLRINGLRYNILKRDGFKCVLCGLTAKDTVLEIDHIIAVCDGGETIEQNLRILCHDCNVGKRIDERER